MRLLTFLLLCLVALPANAQKYVYLTKSSVSPWTLPSDWPGWGYVACIGNGGQGSSRISSSRGGTGGGGAEFAAEPRLVVSANPAFVVGAGNGTGNTTFTGASVTVTCHPGGNGTTSAAGVGGTGSTNTLHFNGSAGILPPSTGGGFGGGGGAAGEIVGAGQPASTNIGGANFTDTLAFCTAGNPGPNGFEWGSSIGSGYGGCGVASGTGNGGAGGQFGGGGAGAGPGSAGSTGGSGGDGQIIVVYYPLNTDVIAMAGPPGVGGSGSGSGVSSSTGTTYIQYINDLVAVSIGYCINSSCVAGSGIAVSSVTDTAGNSCSQIPNAVYTGANGTGAAQYYCPNTVSTGSDTFTVSYGAPVYYDSVTISEWMRVSGPLVGVGNNANGSSTTASVSTNGSTTGPNQLIISLAFPNSFTGGQSQTLIGVPPAPVVLASGSTLISADQFQIGATVSSYTHTWNVTAPWAATIASFQPLQCLLAMLGVGC